MSLQETLSDLREQSPWILPVVTGLVVLVLGFVVVQLLPEVYRSRAEIVADSRSQERSSLSDFFLYEFADEKVARLLLINTAPDCLDQLLAEFDAELTAEDRLDLIQSLEDKIFLDFLYEEKQIQGYWSPVRVVASFWLVVDTDNPELSAYLANALATQIVADYTAIREEDTQQTLSLIDGRLQELTTQISQQEEQIRVIETRSDPNALTSDKFARGRLARLQDRLLEAETELTIQLGLLGGVRAQVSELQQLVQRPGERWQQAILSTLQQAERRLEELARTFSPDHPDVKAQIALVYGIRSRLSESGKNPSTREISILNSMETWEGAAAEAQAAITRLGSVIENLKREIQMEEERLKFKEADSGEFGLALLELAALVRESNRLQQTRQRLLMVRLLDETELYGYVELGKAARIGANPLYPNQLALGVLVFYVALVCGLGVFAAARKLDTRLTNRMALKAAVGDCELVCIPKIE